MMRRIFFTIAILLFSWNVFSQGIQFETGSWKEVLQKAEVLIEALPYIQRFNRKIIVVKHDVVRSLQENGCGDFPSADRGRLLQQEFRQLQD